MYPKIDLISRLDPKIPTRYTVKHCDQATDFDQPPIKNSMIKVYSDHYCICDSVQTLIPFLTFPVSIHGGVQWFSTRPERHVISRLDPKQPTRYTRTRIIRIFYMYYDMIEGLHAIYQDPAYDPQGQGDAGISKQHPNEECNLVGIHTDIHLYVSLVV
jgi:hypothetical protein